MQRWTKLELRSALTCSIVRLWLPLFIIKMRARLCCLKESGHLSLGTCLAMYYRELTRRSDTLLTLVEVSRPGHFSDGNQILIE